MIEGFDPTMDTLTFRDIVRDSLITWQRSSKPRLGIAWKLDDGDVTLSGIGAVPQSQLLTAWRLAVPAS